MRLDADPVGPPGPSCGSRPRRSARRSSVVPVAARDRFEDRLSRVEIGSPSRQPSDAMELSPTLRASPATGESDLLPHAVLVDVGERPPGWLVEQVLGGTGWPDSLGCHGCLPR